jgi:hypothetical protein
MRRKTAFMLLGEAFCGAVIGLLIGAYLSAIAAPSYSRIAVSWSQAAELEKIARLGELMTALARWALLPAILAAGASWLMIARRLNPHLPAFSLRGSPRSGPAWLATVLSGLAVGGAVATASDSTSTIFSSGAETIGRWSGLLLAALGGAAAWVVISHDGWAGEFKEWRNPWKAAARPWLTVAALGAGFGSVLFFGVRALDRLFGFLFVYNVEIWHPGSQVRIAAIDADFAILGGLGALSFASAAAFAAAFAADEAPARERLKRAAPGLAVAFACWTAAVCLRAGLVAENDWSAGGLAQAAGVLEDAPPPLTMVYLGFDRGPKTTVKPWELSVRYSGWTSSGDFPTTEESAAALERFLAGRGSFSRYRGAAVGVLPLVRAILWQPDMAFGRLARLTPRVEPTFIEGLLERAWLTRVAPVTPENRARLEALSDDKLYRIPGHAALGLAKAWARFGDLPRARSWLDAARANATGADLDEAKKYSLPARPPLVAGRVKGRVALRGRSGAPILVGLFQVPDESKSSEPPGHGTGVLVRLAGSTPAGRGGRFEFSNLSAGRYALGFLLPAESVPPNARGAKVSRQPGIVLVDSAHPRPDLGTIELSFPVSR